VEAGRRLAGPAFRDTIYVGRREYQSRPVGEDGRPSLAYRHCRREWERLSPCILRKDADGLLAEVIQPVGVYWGCHSDVSRPRPNERHAMAGIARLARGISWVSSDKGRWACFAAGLFIALGMYRSHLTRLEKRAEEAHKQRPPALSLPTTQITDIAVYLRDRSAWGWRKQKELNIKNFVQDAVPDELRRGGRSGEVRYIGAPSDDTISQEINPGYWGTAEFDPARIWDDRNWSFTIARLGSAYILDKRFVRAPREDVMRTWPPASLALRLYVQFILWWRRVRRGLPASALD
jgi:hypothetical protein